MSHERKRERKRKRHRERERVNILNNNNILISFQFNEFYNEATEINQMKNDIKMKCKNPNEFPATTTTTTTTTTTQNPMYADVIEFKKSLSNFFDNLFTELREANEKLRN